MNTINRLLSRRSQPVRPMPFASPARVAGTDNGSTYTDDNGNTWKYEKGSDDTERGVTSAYGGQKTSWMEADSWLPGGISQRARVNRQIDTLAFAGKLGEEVSSPGDKTATPPTPPKPKSVISKMFPPKAAAKPGAAPQSRAIPVWKVIAVAVPPVAGYLIKGPIGIAYGLGVSLVGYALGSRV